MALKIRLTSFENSSILRKMTVLYFLMSIIPVSVLYFLYMQLREIGRIDITESNLSLTLFFMVLGVAVGYIAMRSMIGKIIDITKENRQALEEILGPDQIRALSSGDGNEITILAKSFNEIIAALEENVRNLELAKKTLHSVLARVGEGIISMDNIDNFLNLIVETVTEAIQADIGLIILVNDNIPEEMFVKSICGKHLTNAKLLKFRRDNPIFKDVLESKKAQIIDKIPRDGGHATLFRVPLLCAPLVLHDHVIGIILVCGRRSEEVFNNDEIHLMNNLANQTAVAIENSKLNENAGKTYFETIAALALAVEAKDPFSRGHLERVSKMVVRMAEELNLNQDDINTLRDAARLHDIGKIGVTDKVLVKQGPLTAQEMDMMKKHCEIGEGIIKPIRSLRNLCDLVRHHHEKLDGTGYPDGLKGTQIHPLVRILTVADIYDALTADRPYRIAFPKDRALEALRSMKDQVDQRIVEVLARLVS